MKNKKKLIRALLILSVLCAGSSYTDQNKLYKVYHHQTNQQQADIELGSVVLYFDQKPIINMLPHRTDIPNTAQKHIILFLPKAQIAGKNCQKMIERLNKMSRNCYQVKLQEVVTPTDGIKVVIDYDPNRVSFSYDHYESHGLQRGLVFRFYNKALLQKLGTTGTALLRTAHLKKKITVVLDCGHGGHDYGACGHFGIKEKDITVAIGKKIAHLLKKQGISVALTRHNDIYLPLDERTSRARKVGAQLFVSLHANYAENPQASGIETYYLDAGLLSVCKVDKKLSKDFMTAIDVGYHGKNKYEKKRNQLLVQLKTQYIPHKHVVLAALNKRCQLSKNIAQLIHHNALSAARIQYPRVVDRSIKHGVYQVLVGTTMPAVLIELGFVSNKKEARLLANAQYQELLARGIAAAINSYVRSFR